MAPSSVFYGLKYQIPAIDAAGGGSIVLTRRSPA
jgi:hypothetical protein